MHVLVLFSSSQLGGAERSLSRMAFSAKEIRYQLATLDGEGPWCDWVRSHGVQPLVLGDEASGSTGLRPGVFWRLLKYVRHNPVDVLYVCGARASLVLRFLCIFLPKLKLVHGVRWNPDSNNHLDRFFRIMERFTHPLVDAWITNSAAARKTLVERCRISPDRVVVIYNGIELLPKDAIPLNKRPMEILTVANLNPRKGHIEYLRVIREVVNTTSTGVIFVFVGRDDMDGEVQRAIKVAGLDRCVRYEGFKADVSRYFQHARMCVLPSLWGEGCPTSLLESFSWGVPVIAYDIDGVSELVEDGVNGLLVPPGSSELLADRIIRLLGKVELAERYGQAGKMKVLEQFSLTQCVSRHTKYFFDLEDHG